MVSGDGMYCDCCGLCSNISCTSIADRTEPCKAITSKSNEPMKHHWIKGNLPSLSKCEVCDEECFDYGLKNLKCCWCHRTVHSKCKPHIAEVKAPY